ncbi:trans-sulfuration enzyme family protein [Vulcanisaeta thermophila]|uniref:trans-sulfuration enzyme family protein n=1 Tax=Vulcanisaeta thermophila TaxID=867917 RepID=UPI000853E293|nr:aminotransferase class I/II-fold pyridoxal phosphate-dependent enzyme [Vulcanisaeta thermophila]
MGKGTKAVRGGVRHVDEKVGPVVEPIYQSSLFMYRDPEVKEVPHTIPLKYSREDNPTVYAVETKMAELEGGAAALGFSSGMAAITTVLIALGKPGSRIVMPLDVYGSTLVFMEMFSKYGINITITDPGTESVIKALDKGADFVFVESVSNPLLRVYDIPSIVRAAKDVGAVVIVDNTLATPIGMTPLEHGTDIVIHSATKYLSGHNDAVAGFMVGGDVNLVNTVWDWRRVLGTIMEPQTAFLVDRGLKTLHVRMKAHEENARAVAEFLSEHPKVKRVYYPCLPNHETYEVARKLLRNCGGIVSFEVKGSMEDAMRVYRSVKLIIPSVSFGGVESIITHPGTTTHRHWTPDMKARAGIRDNLLRLSVGLEDVEDVIEDLDRALRSVP